MIEFLGRVEDEGGVCACFLYSVLSVRNENSKLKYRMLASGECDGFYG